MASAARAALLVLACAGLAAARPLVRNVRTDDEFRKLLKHHAEVRARASAARGATLEPARAAARGGCAARAQAAHGSRHRPTDGPRPAGDWASRHHRLLQRRVRALPPGERARARSARPLRRAGGQTGRPRARGHGRCVRTSGGFGGGAPVCGDGVRARGRWRPSTSKWLSSTRTRRCLPRSTSTPTTRPRPRSRSGTLPPFFRIPPSEHTPRPWGHSPRAATPQQHVQ